MKRNSYIFVDVHRVVSYYLHQCGVTASIHQDESPNKFQQADGARVFILTYCYRLVCPLDFDWMSLFVRVDIGFFTHRKTLRLFSRLGESAFWIPIRLWSYAAQQQEDGVFEQYSAEEIAMLIGYTKDATSMLQALIESGFLDTGPLRIHQWTEYNGFHAVFSERAKRAARVRWGLEQRERTKEKGTESTERRGEEKYQASPSNASSITTSPKVAFAPPTPEECFAFGSTIGLLEEGCKAWRDHFSSNGWKISGKSPMRDWQASMRTWKRNESKYENNAGSNGVNGRKPTVAEDRNSRIVGAEATKRAILERHSKPEPKPWDKYLAVPNGAVQT